MDINALKNSKVIQKIKALLKKMNAPMRNDLEITGNKSRKLKSEDRYKVRYVKQNVLKEFFRLNRKTDILICVLTVLSVGMSTSIALVMQSAIDSIMENASMNRFLLTIGACAAVLVTALVINFFVGKLKNRYSEQFQEALNDNLFSEILKKNVVIFGKRNTGEYLSLFQADISCLQIEYIEGRWMLVSSISSCLLGLLCMLRISVKLTIMILTLQMVPAVFSFIFGNRLIEYQSDTIEKRSRFVTETQDYLKGFDLIKSFASEGLIKRKFSIHNRLMEESSQRYNDKNIVISVMNEAFGYVMMIGLFFFGGIAVINNSLKISSVIVCSELMVMISGPLSVLSMQINMLRTADSIFIRIYDLIYSDKEDSADRSSALKNSSVKLNDRIDVRNVSFSYDGRRQILNNVSCTFEKGKKYVLVGNSGSGKSTLLKLLQGYYNDFGGDILFDRTSLKNIDLNNITKLVSIVQQDVFIFNATVKENITLFNHYPYREIESAIERSGLSSFISTHGLDYFCGENGRDLSGGEKQRISIARCLLRETGVILFDEATSALDNATSAEIEHTISSLTDATCIVITHKINPEVLRNYDQILVFNNGQIVERGHVDELMASKGSFYNLYMSLDNMNAHYSNPNK